MSLDFLAPRQGTLGVACGEAVHRLATLRPQRSLPVMTVVLLVGPRASPAGYAAETCTSLITGRMEAARVFLYAPAFLGDPELVAAPLR